MASKMPSETSVRFSDLTGEEAKFYAKMIMFYRNEVKEVLSETRRHSFPGVSLSEFSEFVQFLRDEADRIFTFTVKNYEFTLEGLMKFRRQFFFILRRGLSSHKISLRRELQNRTRFDYCTGSSIKFRPLESIPRWRTVPTPIQPLNIIQETTEEGKNQLGRMKGGQAEQAE